MDEFDVLGELSVIRRLLEDIRNATVVPLGLMTDWRFATWPAGGVDDVDLGGEFAGVFLYNQEAFDVYVGFAPGTGTAARKTLTLGSGAAISLPYRCSYVSAGGALVSSAGGLVISPLAVADGAGGGKLK